MAPCPHEGCGKSIQEWEFNQYITEDQRARLDKMVNDYILNQSHNVVACKCGNIMELEEGKIDHN